MVQASVVACALPRPNTHEQSRLNMDSQCKSRQFVFCVEVEDSPPL